MKNRKFLADKFRKVVLAGFFLALTLMLTPLFAQADNYGAQKTFNVDKSYDTSNRTKISSTLVWAGGKIYFYVDDAWWANLTAVQKSSYSTSFQALDTEFSKTIYPKLTTLYGTDVNPMVDRGGKITVLVHPMVKDAGGYINTGDGYSKSLVPTSNEREMVYMNTRFIDSALAKAYLAHEFTHLITFNQKDLLRDVTEDIWLNEARADYASTILGYDSPYAGGNFEQRVTSYAADSGKSLTEWLNKPANYGAAHLFMQYIVDQYGTKILADSMASSKVGIAAINYALAKNNYNIDFNHVFRNWLIALTVNDCSLGSQYCYRYAPLANFRITPRINYLPTSDQASLSVMYNTSYFAGNWQKIVGGAGDLTLEISSPETANFWVPYLLCYAKGGECMVGDLDLDENGKAVLKLPKFGSQYASLTLMPFATGKITGFNTLNASTLSYTFRIAVAAVPEVAGAETENSADNAALIARLTAQIEQLKSEILKLQAVLAARLSQSQTAAAGSKTASAYSCAAITADLYYGVENYGQVKCLQEFLAAQGSQIYPQGAVSGSFSTYTRDAVSRFQEKYASEILAPLGLTVGTGYVGASTRKTINRLIAG